MSEPAPLRTTRGPISRVLALGTIALAVALGICFAIWSVLPTTLQISTPIVGWPIFADFDYERYIDAFYLVAIVFPLAVLGTYVAADRILRTRSRRDLPPFFPIAAATDPLAAEHDEGDESSIVSWLAAALRIGVPAVTVAIEVAASGTSTGSIDTGAWMAGAAYVLAVVVLAAVLGRTRRTGAQRTLAGVNSVLGLVVVPLLSLVSSATTVSIASTGRLVAYPWFPWWAALIATSVALGWRIRAARRGRSDRSAERTVVYVLVGSLALFLLVASLPGALGPFGGFDDAQNLAGAQLTLGHGLLPWRDVYLLHGPFEDALDAAIGFGVFSHTRWGAVAGVEMFVTPFAYVVFYLFTLYFARARRFFAVIVALLILAGQFSAIPRFSYMPLLVIALDLVLRTRRRRWGILLGALLVVEAALTPEIAIMFVGIGGTLIAHDACTRAPKTPWRSSFPLAVSVFWGLIVAGVPFLVYLIATGSFVAFVDYYRIFGSNHALWGAYPAQWSLRHDLEATVQFVLPVVVLLGSAWCWCWRLRTRRGFTSRMWCMVASGSFVIGYFEKGLDRLDTGHVAEVLAVSTPLIVIAGIELAAWLDDGLRSLMTAAIATLTRASGRIGAAGRRLGREVLAISPAALVAPVVLVASGAVVTSTLTSAPSRMHAASPTPAPGGSSSLLGYTGPGDVNTTEIDQLGAVLAKYAGSGPVFDFANEPGITYFLLNRVPGSSSFHVESAQTPLAQQLVISQLELSRPHLVIFTDYDFGLPIYDYIVGGARQYLISRYLLTHYRPFADVQGQLVLIRSDLYRSTQPVSSMHLSDTAGASRLLYFQSFNCNLGDIPDFLSYPVTTAGSVRLTLEPTKPVNTTVEGWAVDDRSLVPAKEVFAVVNGRVIAETTPNELRPDIEAYFHTDAVADSGFQLQLDVPPGAHVKLFALNADGTVSRIQPDPSLDLPATLRSTASSRMILDGSKALTIERGAHLSGWVTVLDRYATERTFTLSLPAGAHWNAFEWATVTLPAGTAATTFTLSDGSGESGHNIEFSSLTGKDHLLATVGSCLEWYGFQKTISLVETGSSVEPTITLSP